MYKAALLCLTVVCAHLEVRPAGWLDRAAAYHKQKFLDDLDRFAPVKIHATIEQAPPGYQDSKLWDYETVVHLLNLIRESDTAAPVRHALRRALRPTRKFMSRAESFKHFPSLINKNTNMFYYDIESEYEMDSDTDWNSHIKGTTKFPDDYDIIVVSNPVEARLPSAQISVKLLREIMEARALAGRIMPSTKPSTIYWKPMNKTTEGDKKPEEKVNGTEITEIPDGKETTGFPDGKETTKISDGEETTVIPDGKETTETPAEENGDDKKPKEDEKAEKLKKEKMKKKNPLKNNLKAKQKPKLA